MKSLTFSFLAVPILILGACSSPLGRMERIWPDGATVEMDDLQITVSMSGSGSFTAKRMRWIGTNGFPFPSGTNNTSAVIATPVPAGSVILSR